MPQRGGEAFAVGAGSGSVWKERRVQAILRRCGRGQDTDLRILSDGEDGLRRGDRHLVWEEVPASSGLVPCCAMDHANRKGIFVSPCGDDFQERLATHWANLNSMKWMLWNNAVEMSEFRMTGVRIGLFQHALAHPEANSERFEGIEAKLDELRSYLYANRESVRDTPHRDVIGVQTSLGEQFLDVPVRQGKTQIPTNRQKDDFRFELPPLEQTGNR
jgi:hypothetical protein